MVADCRTIEHEGHDAWSVGRIQEAGIGHTGFALLVTWLWIERIGMVMDAVGRSPRVRGFDEG